MAPARQVLREASPYERVVIHTGLGDTEAAFAGLERAYAETLRVAHFGNPVRRVGFGSRK